MSILKRWLRASSRLRPGTTAGNSLAVLDRGFLRGGPLESLKDLPDLLVFNDEAHHIHEIKQGGEVSEVEWQKSLTDRLRPRGTASSRWTSPPRHTTRSAAAKKLARQYFPHIVVDFDLNGP